MRYAKHSLDESGWTEWFKPALGYRIGCCDCGLVHDMEFRMKRGQVQIRARRNERATAAKRRHRKTKYRCKVCLVPERTGKPCTQCAEGIRAIR